MYLLKFRNVLAGKVRLCALLLASVFCLMVPFQTMGGELYYWKDKDGNVYMSDTPPEKSDSRESMKTIRSPSEPAAAPTLPSADSQKEVVIYTKATCPYCRDAKDFFAERDSLPGNRCHCEPRDGGSNI